ncbi:MULTISPECIES: hypothetical protein [Stenotrophomonas maltophilia group]|uniref:hypothetical protein n=1 Tax=Stenotrophomonas maltophilia group TaxID=995085 RepID=UPI0016612F6F|nr:MULTISPECIES: hypothetical protein [Stenotrophomonas maltophilia group]
MPMTALAIAVALSGHPTLDWEKDRAEDSHMLTLCQIRRDQLHQSRVIGDDERYARATEICDMLAQEYAKKWDFDELDARALPTMDFVEAILRGYAVVVTPTPEELKQFESL